ncbi:TIGR03620 family F420-dependent LLM class oxidoreductase [Microbacterium sp. SLBN-146]|uniref:TIGR03620 family F420-dependent LLM class oxidoreductase n=1 Tax=Microbacterium sp. SLBN-146 TaxID=2768457 RepID=UPI001152DCC7|nr:TIGR03620 family F420-dependent LLM class oxidoreductase [Microbacterium sp. SLBN-146]TQJ29931.1 putative F420-dependent oxidoreductase [Microbacterium sp. SLBN-146]
MIPAGPWGVWSGGLRVRDAASATAAAQRLEAAGYSALWMTGGVSNPFARVRELLAATSRVAVATGILSIWTMRPAEVVAELHALTPADRGRFLLGLGVSHASLVDRDDPGRYRRPLTAMREYLDELDACDPDGLAMQRVLAALGPRMLDLSATRASGAHPYLTTPAHTQRAREVLGTEPFLAPTQMVVLEPDAATARAAARRHLSLYLGQPNYVANWVRLGFTSDDAAEGGSDRLIDAMIAWGDEDAVAARLREHLDAGADHVCISILDRQSGWRDYPLPVADWERLAPTLPR